MVIDPRLLSAVRCAALDPRKWRDVILEMERASGGARIAAFGTNGTGSQDVPMPAIIGSFDPDFVQTYADHFGALNPWTRRFAQMPVDRPHRSADLVADAKLMRSEFYQDWVRPQDDIRGGVGLRVALGQGCHAVFAANVRQRDRNGGEDRLIRLLHRIAPDLRHALQVNAALQQYAARVALSEASRGARDIFVALDAERRVLFQDPEDRTALPFRIDPRSRFHMRSTLMEEWLTRMLCAARGAPMPADCTDGIWRVKAVAMPDDALDQTPFAQAGTEQGSCFGLIFQRVTEATSSQERLRTRFGLTATEAEVALAAARGASAAEIALERQVSRHTVRNQIRSAIAKTEARRLGDLIRIVTTHA